MFGIGWATAEDRLFFIDALRHAGQGDLAQFAGGANVAMDESVWSSEPYTQQDLATQVTYGSPTSRRSADLRGRDQLRRRDQRLHRGRQGAARPADVCRPSTRRLGIWGARPVHRRGPRLDRRRSSAASSAAEAAPSFRTRSCTSSSTQRFGGEHYAVPGSPQGCARRPCGAAATHRRPRARFVDHSGFATFDSFVDPADPEAPTTVHGRSFPYQTLPLPSKTAAASLALPDPGSVGTSTRSSSGALPAAAVPGRQLARRSQGAAGSGSGSGRGERRPGLLAFPHTTRMRCWCPGRTRQWSPDRGDGAPGHLLPPEILMEEDIHGPGIDADGAAFPGQHVCRARPRARLRMVGDVGGAEHHRHVRGAALQPRGRHAVHRFRLLPDRRAVFQMQTLTRSEAWHSNLADSTPSGRSPSRRSGPRTGSWSRGRRSRVGPSSTPTCARRTCTSSTRRRVRTLQRAGADAQPAGLHERRLPDRLHVQLVLHRRQAHRVLQLGAQPGPCAATNPLFPTWASFSWKGFHPSAELSPASLTEQQTPQSAHPQTVDQEYLTSWNNKQAPGYNDAATGQEFSSIYRSQLLDLNIRHYLAGGSAR